jgi:hypothetical protein
MVTTGRTADVSLCDIPVDTRPATDDIGGGSDWVAVVVARNESDSTIRDEVMSSAVALFANDDVAKRCVGSTLSYASVDSIPGDILTELCASRLVALSASSDIESAP